MARGEQHGLLGTLPFRLAAPAAEDQQVFVSGAGALADFGHGGGEVALQALGVVKDAQAALLAKGFEFVALLAADGSGLGDREWPPAAGLRASDPRL